MHLYDRAFQRVFSRLFVYNILWEDSEVDESNLEIHEDSTLLEITGAGCRLAGHLSRHPRTIDAVDINPHHLALAALKVAAAQRLRSYASFYDLLGRGGHPEHAAIIRWVTGLLPQWIQRYWKRNSRMFADNFYQKGLTARMFAGLRRLAGIDAEWLRELCAMPVERRVRAIEASLAPAMRSPLIARLLESPLQLLAIGVNFEQRDRIVRTNGLGLVEYLVEHVKRVASTDLERNWFAWTAIAGHYNHDQPDAVPPYLRRDRHARSFGAPTRVHYHNRDIFDVLAEAEPDTWSHFTLCDMPDWLPPQQQRQLLGEIVRTSRDGGILTYRSVEPESMIARHGLERQFHRLHERSAAASRMDRSRQYAGVNYYRIVH